jgi:FtsH-binding integral membrane protein
VNSIAGPNDARGTGHLGVWALCLGAGSVILVVLGFGWLAFGFPLGIVLAIVALVLGATALRRRQPRSAAIAGVTLGLLTVLAVLFLVLSLAFAPGD